jgi:hypothetical protein
MHLTSLEFILGGDRFSRFLNRRGCYIDEGGQGGGGGQGTNTSTKGDGDKQGKESTPYAVFQDEASFKARLEGESKTQFDSRAKELGFDSFENLQAARQKAEDEKKATLDTANARLVNAEIKIAAQAVGFIDPADAVALVDRSGLRVDDQGNVVGVKETIEKLAKGKPHLLTGKNTGSPGSAGNIGRQDGSGETDVDRAKKMAEERNKGVQAPAGGYDPWHKN